MLDIPTLSATKLKTYIDCQRKYWYQYIEKEPSTRHPSAAMGSAVHEVIRTLHQWDSVNPGASCDVVELYQRIYNKEIGDNPVDIPSYTDGLRMALSYDTTKRQPMDIEVEFKLPFPNDKMPICYIHGFIDHLFQWGLVDLKTSKRKPKQDILDNDPQFIIYAWAFKNIMGYDPAYVYWHHLRTSEDIPADVVAVEKMDRLMDVISSILQSHQIGLYDKNITFACSYCPFRGPCLGR